MPRFKLQPLRFVLVALVVVFGVSQSLRAAEPPPPTDKAEVEHLITTIETPEARDRLVAQLKLLIAADKPAEPAEEPGLLLLVTDKLQEVGDEMLVTLSSLGDLGKLVDWAENQVADPHLRSTWAEVLGKLAVIFGGGVAAERLLQLLLRLPRRLVAARPPASRWLRPRWRISPMLKPSVSF